MTDNKKQEAHLAFTEKAFDFLTENSIVTEYTEITKCPEIFKSIIW